MKRNRLLPLKPLSRWPSVDSLKLQERSWCLLIMAVGGYVCWLMLYCCHSIDSASILDHVRDIMGHWSSSELTVAAWKLLAFTIENYIIHARSTFRPVLIEFWNAPKLWKRCHQAAPWLAATLASVARAAVVIWKLQVRTGPTDVELLVLPGSGQVGQRLLQESDQTKYDESNESSKQFFQNHWTKSRGKKNSWYYVDISKIPMILWAVHLTEWVHWTSSINSSLGREQKH